MLQSQSDLIQRLTQQVRSLEMDHQESIKDNRALRDEMAQITVALNSSQVGWVDGFGSQLSHACILN